jgi:serralysin
LWGNGAINNLWGSAGDDWLYGDDGDDVLVGDTGADEINGGGGRDQAGYTFASAAVAASLASGRGSAGEALGDTFSGIEDLGGSQFGDTLTGNNLTNALQGEGGNDILNGGLGADYLEGNDGNDVYVVDNAGDIVDEILKNFNGAAASGIDTVQSSISFSLVGSVRVKGTFENLTLLNVASALTATGNASNNTLTGNNFNNTLTGGVGADVLRGGFGNDVLIGGVGVDTLTGGANNDFFVFNAPLSAANRDVVADFYAPQDTFRLENAVMTKLGAAGVLKANQYFAGAAAHDADDRIIYNKISGALYYDSNGNAAGGVIHLATLTTKPALTYVDFVVV